MANRQQIGYDLHITLAQQSTGTAAIMQTDALSWQICRAVFSLEAFSAISDILDTFHKALREFLLTRYDAFWHSGFKPEKSLVFIRIEYDGQLTITITDTGPGFSEIVLRAFSVKERSKHKDSSEKDRLLTTCSIVEEELNGTIFFSNAQNGGAHVVIMLPFPIYYVNSHQNVVYR